MLSESQLALLRAKSFGAVATLRENGMPHTSLVWLDTDGEHLVFNTKTTRVKGKHLARDPRVSVTVFDPADPYKYFEVEGTAELVLGGAAEHMHELARKYTGEDWSDVSDRVIVKVKPEHVFGYDV